MNLINNNPYRILALPLTASEREIAKQINTLSTYAEMGKSKSFDTDFQFLNPVFRTPYEIEEAKKQLEQSESKLLYSLFWFWKNNSVDELALEILKEGNTSKAIEIWEKSVFASKNKVYKPVILFENLIRQKTAWSEEENESHVLHKKEDEYIIERLKEESYSIPCEFCDLNFEDNWSIECNTEWMNGVDNESYGLVFGREKGSYYYFGIAGSDSFMYCKYIDWTYNPCIKWKDTPKFNKWGANHIAIKKIEKQLTFFVNGVQVDTFEAEPFFGKYFGFRVTKNQKVSFRNFKFYKLVEDEIYGEGINITTKNFSSIKNLSTLYLSLASKNGTLQLDYFKKGIALAKNFFSSEQIEEYSKLIAGGKYIYDTEKILHFYINDVVDSLKSYLDKNGGITTGQLLNAFSNFPVEAKQFLNNRFVAKQVQNIDREIETAQNERRKSPSAATDTGKKLLNNTKADIDFLRNVLGENDFQFQIIGDKLSQAILQCGIDAFNCCKDTKGDIDYAKVIKSEESYLSEYKYALAIAVTDRAKERAQENLDSCNQYIENKHYYNCWFCGNNPPEDINKFEITIYKETSRSYFPRRVQFSYLPVSIPRCSDCQKVHSQSSDKFTLALIGCAVVGLIIGAMADGYWFAGLLVGAVIGWVLGTALKGQQTSKEAIKDTSQSTIRNYPVLNKLLKEGWQFSKPSA
jgi:hypothetical protein